jgi:serine/threonine-protein kinase HipA
LNTLLTWKGTEGLFEELSERFAALSGVSGVQPKVLVSATDDDVIEKVSMKEREFIIKSSGDDYPGLAENEFICMSIAAKAELDVPKCWLSDDRKLFIIERFDIEGDRYLGFEDMTALMNKQNAEKYNGSYEQIAKAINLFVTPAARQSSLESLFSTVALSVLLRNGDAHLKNFGLLYTHPQTLDVRLSPIYDVVTTTVYLPRDVLALKLDKSKAWPTKKQLVEFGKAYCNLDRPEQIAERIADAAMAYRPEEDSAIWQQMKPIINMACFEYAGQLGAP